MCMFFVANKIRRFKSNRVKLRYIHIGQNCMFHVGNEDTTYCIRVRFATFNYSFIIEQRGHKMLLNSDETHTVDSLLFKFSKMVV